MARISQSVPASNSEKNFSKILEKVGMEVPAKDIGTRLPHCETFKKETLSSGS